MDSRGADNTEHLERESGVKTMEVVVAVVIVVIGVAGTVAAVGASRALVPSFVAVAAQVQTWG